MQHLKTSVMINDRHITLLSNEKYLSNTLTQVDIGTCVFFMVTMKKQINI